MKNKGFTLIELLAVIVILAIIALIATPVILNIIDETKDQSVKRSIDHYMSAVTNAIAKANLNTPNKGLNLQMCEIVEDGTKIDCFEFGEFDIEVDGTKPIIGMIYFSNGKIDRFENVVIDETYYDLIDGEIVEKGTATPDPDPVAKACSLVQDNDSNGAVSKGDKVTCGTESFYVISNDGTNTEMLAEFNLKIQ